ncbi:hypothetical protein IFM89_020354 [Coptis chinensis]|uniref:Uncharacterized protein n=1 Tax=Coptis chinensis TaxID=261450 RepID=A0A835H584_9MAGN|nr:hypothetical protein IFM89_020354 [Coptis chinensis]
MPLGQSALKLEQMGLVTKNEWVMVGTMLFAVSLWIFGVSKINEFLNPWPKEKVLQSRGAAVMRRGGRGQSLRHVFAVQRIQARTRERAATGAKERAEKVAAKQRESSLLQRAGALPRQRAEQASAERATTEARERAAARESQQKNENDLESFFGGRASSVPRPNRTTTSVHLGE